MSRYLIDTNVISEPTRSKPNSDVVAWLESAPLDRQWLCTITIAEIYKGIVRAKDDKKRLFLRQWLQSLINDFNGRILSVDMDVAKTLGDILGKKRGSFPPFDTIIASIAITHDLILVTRNTNDFDIPNLSVLNPWKPR